MGYGRIALVLAAAVVLLAGVGVYSGVQLAIAEGDLADRQPRPEWVEPEDLTEHERMAWRPGNYGALGAMADYLAGQHALRPEMRAAAFPHWYEGRRLESSDVFERIVRLEERRAAESGRLPRNRNRQFTIHVESLIMHDIPESREGWQWPESLEATASVKEEVFAAMTEHDGLMVLIRARAPLKSLRSPKIEGGEEDSFLWMLVVKKPEGWRVCMWDLG